MVYLVSLADIDHLYAARGSLAYGESVTQLEHALQCAALAQQVTAEPSLIVAALIHDIGHLFQEDANVTGSAQDQHHEISGAKALAKLFGEAICQPIALHVAAKRYLCFKDPTYFNSLSGASRQSLVLQGGVMDAEAATLFECQPYWREAVMLRHFDDAGKTEEASRCRFADFMPMMESMLAQA